MKITWIFIINGIIKEGWFCIPVETLERFLIDQQTVLSPLPDVKTVSECVFDPPEVFGSVLDSEGDVLCGFQHLQIHLLSGLTLQTHRVTLQTGNDITTPSSTLGNVRLFLMDQHLQNQVSRLQAVGSSSRTVLFKSLHENPRQVSSTDLQPQIHRSLPQHHQPRIRMLPALAPIPGQSQSREHS